ncbi:MAG: hypothetical protein JRC87_07055 [Deltaproteobacteria bacterium]|nr:hypothetical protein [Deltaproteobacteria bacterium]MBW2659334.1 hypothetical protein [Deltaproteobacteria bacterium]
MENILTETYKSWTITVTPENKLCSHFSFTITAPSGYSQHVSMGGDHEKRAFERAREMIDMEIELAREDL